MQKRTKSITLTILAAVAATACDEKPAISSDEDIKHCVDQDGVVQDESKCAGVPDTHHDHDGSAPHHAGGGGHFWYYGGGRSIAPGGRVTGGSYRPSPGRTYSPPSRAPSFSGGGGKVGGGSSPSIGRGGFGGTGGGHAGGGGS